MAEASGGSGRALRDPLADGIYTRSIVRHSQQPWKGALVAADGLLE
jgi:hypothetical protein